MFSEQVPCSRTAACHISPLSKSCRQG